MQKRRRLFLIFIGVVVLVGVLVVVFRREPEPEYGGKKLSEWVVEYLTKPGSTNEIDRAMQQMGTNAIPFLLKWFRYEPATTGTFRKAYTRAINWIWRRSPALGNKLADNRSYRAYGAAIAIVRLGSGAEIAIRELTKLLVDAKAPGLAESAAVVLLGIGEAGLPSLITGLTNQSKAVRFYVAGHIGRFGTKASASIPALRRMLTDPDPELRQFATNALSEIDPEALEKATAR